MPYAFTQDVPINKDTYTGISDQIANPPKGLIVHLAFEISDGMRYVDVWESQADYERFAEEQLHPIIGKAMEKAGISPEEMGESDLRELEFVEIFAPSIPKRRGA